jgi:hypothetical protein
MFINSNSISKTENIKIKNVVLSALKDRYSFFTPSEKVDYHEQHSDKIIQLYQSYEKKHLFCLLNYNFMDTLTVQNDGCYYLKVKMSYPENYYHEFIIENKNNKYVIISWEFDI